jgi:hypothetical protein
MAGTGAASSAHRSALAIDVDYQYARAVLLGRVEGRGRFVSSAFVPSTALPPIDDVSVGAKQSVRAIEEHTGLRIVGPDGVDIPASGEHGVDLFTITGQPVPAIRVNVLALGDSPLAGPLVTAARRTTTIVDILTSRVRTNDGTLSGALLEQEVREFRPDALVIVQGSAAESEWAAAIGTLVSLIRDDVINLIVIVAADQYQQQAAQLIGEQADLRGIDPSEFSVTDITGALEDELQTLYVSRVDPQGLVAASEPARFVSRVRAGDVVSRFVARRLEREVVTVEVGDGTMIHWATPHISDVIVRPEIDVFRHIRAIFDGDLSSVSHWLPFTMSIEDLSHWVLNRALRPHSVAETMPDMAIERAILVELLRSAWLQMPASRDGHVDLILAGRPFGMMREPGLACLSLLDALQPDPSGGVVEIVLDPDGLIAAAGAVGDRSPGLAADIVESDLLRPLTSAIVVRGSGSDGELAIRGQVRYSEGETSRFTVPFGSVHRLRCDPRQTAVVSLVCEGAFTIGGQGQADVTVGPDGDLRGGTYGIVIDARGRPLRLTADPAMRATRVANWLDDLGLRL